MSSAEHEVRYEADERPPLPRTVGLGVQYAVVNLGSVVLTPAILISVAPARTRHTPWAVFAALVVSGLVTVVQSVPWSDRGKLHHHGQHDGPIWFGRGSCRGYRRRWRRLAWSGPGSC